MAVAPPRQKVLFLPVIRGNYDPQMTRAFGDTVQEVAEELQLDAIFPPQAVGNGGLIRTDADLRSYWQVWRGELADIKALIAFSADFMQERRIMDAARLLPEDVPLFLLVANDDPRAMVQGKFGDALCGSLSVHRNVRLLGRELLGADRIDASDRACLREALARCKRTIDGVESLRHQRIAMLGVNPDAFATTFANQVLLFRLGFSLHPYELLDLWGDVVLGAELDGEGATYEAPFGSVRLDQPIRRGEPRVAEALERIRQQMPNLPDDPEKLDLIARCLVWLERAFERDRIDSGAIHCWPQFQRYFGLIPCAVAMLSNLILRKPIVCELDVCHAIMAKLAWEMTGEPGVILDINNPGWDPRVFNVFHCSQTPPNWLRDGAEVLDNGWVQGIMRPEPFTAISAATSADAFHATVFTGHFLTEDPGLRGSSGWAYVPNLPQVLEAIQQTGIHHFVAMKGRMAAEVAGVLRFKGLVVNDISCEVRKLAEIEAELPPLRGQP